MRVIISYNHSKNRIVYHKAGCIYERRIKDSNRIYQNSNNIENNGKYCECAYCGGMKGYMRVYKKSMEKMCQKENVEFLFDDKTETVYVKTDAGFWKIFWKEDIGKCLLYHRNKFDKNLDFSILQRGNYHRQTDVKATSSVMKLFDYVIAHDKAKIIMMDDYRKLPQNTRKQKKYYKQAKNKERRNQVRNIFALFDKLEQKDPSMKALSCC